MSANSTFVFPERFEWYMIRNGFLGPEYSSKLGSLAIAVILMLYDGLTRKRLDYLISFVFGTIVWIVLEYVLLQTGVREYQEGYLNGKLLGFWPAIIIRCTQECGFLMVAALFLGDRLFNCMKGKKERPSNCRRFVEFIICFLFLTTSSVMNMLKGKKDFRDVGSPDVMGRRNMTHIVSVLLFLFTTIVPIIFMIVFRNHKYFIVRTTGFTVFVTWITAIGMVIEYNVNARWVEVGYYPKYMALPSPGHMLLAFLFDLVIEVISPPVFIYHVMVLLRMLPDFKSDDYFNKKKLPVQASTVAVASSKPIELYPCL